MRVEHPGVRQIACFDTAFHATNDATARRFGLPRALEADGIVRYGFHGLSYEYVAGELARVSSPAATRRTIVAHLGSGASLCALVDGRSVATTMSFSVLDGLVMGTRCGSLDPEVVLYLQRERGMTLDAVERLLYEESGLLGVSGTSSDMRELLASDAPEAAQAVALFVYRIVRDAGSLAAAAGGLDAFVFTAGIGEGAPAIRKSVCAALAWLGIALDDAANEAPGATAARRISAAESRVAVWVIPTDEERPIAEHTARAVGVASAAAS
jgi:acetate kinase